MEILTKLEGIRRDNAQFLEEFDKLCRELSLHQFELASRMSINSSLISAYRKGVRRVSNDIIQRLCEALEGKITKTNISSVTVQKTDDCEMLARPVVGDCNTNINDKGIQINSPVNAGHDVKVQGYIDILDVVKESQRQSSEVLRQTAQMQEMLKAMIDKIK